VQPAVLTPVQLRTQLLDARQQYRDAITRGDYTSAQSSDAADQPDPGPVAAHVSTPLVCTWCNTPLVAGFAGLTVRCPHCDRRCERLACTRCLHASRTPTDRR